MATRRLPWAMLMSPKGIQNVHSDGAASPKYTLQRVRVRVTELKYVVL